MVDTYFEFPFSLTAEAMNEHTEEPKLIIDEDWKTQVQREKEEFERNKTASDNEPDGDTLPTAENPQPSEDSQRKNSPSLPPASLPMLVASLGAQAMASLGQLPDDDGKTLPVNLAFAKHFIDLIGVIEEKTKGNLTPDENHYVQETLHQLRMTFIEIKSRQT